MSDDDDSEPGAEAIYPDRGPDREGMVADYLPNEEDWAAKSLLDLNDPHALAAVQQFEHMFPEVDDLQPLIDEFTQEFLKGRTSIGGEARDEYNRIFEAMYGGHPDEESKKWASLLGADMGDED